MTDSISGPTLPDSHRCRQDAQNFADDALRFLAHFGPEAAYPADLYYVILRGEFVDFEAHHCAAALLGDALNRGLTAKQRSVFIADLPRSMASVVRRTLS